MILWYNADEGVVQDNADEGVVQDWADKAWAAEVWSQAVSQLGGVSCIEQLRDCEKLLEVVRSC